MEYGLKENDQLIFDDKERANVFNKYFVNVAAQWKGPTEKSDFKHITEFVNCKVPNNTSFSIATINSSFIEFFEKSGCFKSYWTRLHRSENFEMPPIFYVQVYHI